MNIHEGKGQTDKITDGEENDYNFALRLITQCVCNRHLPWVSTYLNSLQKQ